MNLHTVRLADTPAEPWRNGGGRTRPLLAWPVRTAADWALRVSVADIDADGPFSAFAGVQRAFAVLEGAGVWLDLPGRSVRLGPGDPPLAFDGADAPGCTLLDGPTRDLNLMSRCGRPLLHPAVGPLSPGPRWRGLYAHGPARLLCDGRPAATLDGPGLVWSDDDRREWRLDAAPGRPADRPAYWLELAD